ncbi:ABC transporter substrate-binding protein [Aestuariirhabdus haliotis]|uniref:ABC transporter substrate-binding protein n=1 Tax=Aestuariirhabdus haliotis TaxID=2918751 RepID=UPI00201B440D|nr:ABC transporter substrate-binding protein [Aestuariirhabdus haliotis]MCL6419655.1 ABC transporter substrate-binding protein [Aestuariirhabdus haliotis]
MVLMLACLVSPVYALEKVTLQLKWKHQFQFAGYYAAIEHGYYRAAGLDVKVREAVEGKDPVRSVLDGNAEFGVGTSDLLLMFQRGEPVVVLGVVYQHSPLGLMVLRDGPVRNVHDLAGKPLMIEPNSAELFAFMEEEGIASTRLDIVHHSFDVQDLLSGKVDGLSVYVTDEPFLLKQAGVDYHIYEASQGGIDFYGDNFFTTRKMLQQAPETVAAFRDATMKGWRYAMDHPEEMVQLILAKYSTRHSADHLRFEAREMQRLLRHDLVDAGYMSRARWEHIASIYEKQGMLSDNVNLDDFLYDQIQPEGTLVQAWVWVWLMVMLASLLLIVAFYRLNSRLRDSERWLTTLFDHAPTALVQINSQGLVEGWSYQAEQVFGWRRDEVMGRNINDFLVPIEEQQGVEMVLEGMGARNVQHHENWNLTKSGRKILCDWHNVVLSSASRGRVVVSMAMDITERKRMEARLHELAHTDLLTGVANRTLFYDQFARAIQLANRRKAQLALMFVDLDDFKEVNDLYGHESGDSVLQVTVARIRGCIRGTDILARHGGDEFVVLLEDCGNRDIIDDIASKIVDAVSRPIPLPSGATAQIGTSIGISLYPDNGDDCDTLMRAADRAMYQVKAKSKQGYQIGDGEFGS